MPFAPPNYTMPNLSSGMDDAIIGTVTAVPIFIPMFLLFVFGVVTIGGSISQKRRTGLVDLPMWATMGAMTTLMISIAMTTFEGMMNLYTLSTVVTITIFCGFWLFMDRGRNEI